MPSADELILNTAIDRGNPELPACVLIHGLGMNKYMWSDPGKARIMGGLLPMRAMLAGYDEPLETLFHDLSSRGFTVITWSQKRPVGPTQDVVQELYQVMNILGNIPHNGLILIGHSRGGLAARSALARADFLPEGETLRGLFTLASPHEGSDLSRWAGYVSMLASVMPDINENKNNKKSVGSAINRMLGFIKSKGVMEIMPSSLLLRSLPKASPHGAYCFSAGGTNPALIEIRGGFSFPSSLQRVVPSKLFPDEIADGKGDGLVSAQSSHLSFAEEHMDFHVNHAAIAVDKEVRSEVLKRIEKHCLR